MGWFLLWISTSILHNNLCISITIIIFHLLSARQKVAMASCKCDMLIMPSYSFWGYKLSWRVLNYTRNVREYRKVHFVPYIWCITDFWIAKRAHWIRSSDLYIGTSTCWFDSVSKCKQSKFEKRKHSSYNVVKKKKKSS